MSVSETVCERTMPQVVIIIINNDDGESLRQLTVTK